MPVPPLRRGPRALGLLPATALLATTALLSAGLTGTAGAAAPTSDALEQGLKPAATGDALGSADRTRLATAKAQGKREVTVMVVSRKGQDATAQLRALGGSVRYSAPGLGYTAVALPTASVEKAAGLPSVLAVDLDQQVPLPDERPDAAGTPTGNLTAPDATTPGNNPFLPVNETRSLTFRQQHKGWDGRGVTIGVLDTGVDLSHPSLQTTTTGARKVTDWFTATDPVLDGSLVQGGDPTWVPMVDAVSGPTAGYDGVTWTLPAGAYRIHTVVEADTALPGCEVCGDLNRDGDTTDRIGVLYDPVTHDVRVDADDDKDFTDEPVMRPYREQHQVGTLGTDKPFTDVREAMPFTVDYRPAQDLSPLGISGTADFVDLGVVSGEHGSHVAGITAAKNLFGGIMDGQAPGAQLVSARACGFGAGCSSAALTTGMAMLATRGVDVINMSIGGLPLLNDGDNARAALYDRIVDLGVQIVLSAGNSGSALNTVGDPAVATKAVAVGASISAATWRSNYGSAVRFDRGMLPFSSGGPREDGGLKPDVTAPGAAISTTPTWLPGAPVREAGYALPAGYAMLQGTSMAAPEAAGAMALLLSAARQTGRTTTTAQLRSAVFSGAAYNADVPAFLQGHGQVDTPRAWALLEQGLAPDAYTVSAPVCNEVWRLLGRTTGTGLYNRCAADQGGQAVGQERSYPVTVTRTTGPKAAGTYRLSVVGDDGTFSLGAGQVRLPRDRAVTVMVTSRPQEGSHSALLRLDDPSTPQVDLDVMLDVTAARTLAAPAYTSSWSGTSYRNEAQRYYVTVPAGARALEVQLGGLADGSQTRWLAFHPYGVPVDDTSTPSCYSNYSSGCNTGDRVYASPTPGVWELLVESRRTSPLLANPFTLTAQVLGVTVDPPQQTLAQVAAGVAAPVAWTVRNDFGATAARATGGQLASAVTARPSIGAGAVVTRTVTVPAGAGTLDVTIGSATDTGADLDLVVEGPSGAKQSAGPTADEAVHYDAPQPGDYTVRVLGYAVPSGSTAFEYRDAYSTSVLGTLDVDQQVTLPAGGSTEVRGTLTARQAVPEGRSLYGQVRLVTGSGALLGSAEVYVGAVSPA